MKLEANRRTVLAGALGSVALIGARDAGAQAWPSKLITIVMPYAAGGSTDVIARAIADKLRPSLGVPIIVERSMWWPGDSTQWFEAHNSPGATATGTRWALAEGEEGGPFNSATFILIANTAPAAASVRVTPSWAPCARWRWPAVARSPTPTPRACSRPRAIRCAGATF